MAQFAFAEFQLKLRLNLSDMNKDDKEFWSLVKELGGIDQERNSAAPDAQSIADHFALKMSNGADDLDVDFVPRDSTRVPLSGWKVRYKKVLQTLKRIDASKSANGISPSFWKNTASVLAPAVTKLFKFIVRKAKWPSRWKIPRVTALHKRDSVKDPANYRPVSVLANLSVYFEGVIDDQFDDWVSNFIPIYESWE